MCLGEYVKIGHKKKAERINSQPTYFLHYFFPTTFDGRSIADPYVKISLPS